MAELAAGTVLADRFQIGEMIGGGWTGQVHQAMDQQSQHPVVIKLVDPSVFPTSLQMQRTQRELNQLERLNETGIAQILGHGKHGEQMWIATEWVEGYSLQELIAASGPMAPARATAIVLAIGRALTAAARAGVIHRDVSPKNVLIGTGDQVKLINFGVALPGHRILGVPEFVAPEQVEGKPVDQRSNIYSLGALYYLMLTGAPPYSGEPEQIYQQHLAGNPPAPSSHASVSPEIDKLVSKAMERSSSRRYMTLGQMIGDLERIAAALGGAQAAQAHEPSPASTQPMGRAGQGAKGSTRKPGKRKQKAFAQTMLGGFTALPGPAGNAPASPAAGTDAVKTAQLRATPPAATQDLSRDATEPAPVLRAAEPQRPVAPQPSPVAAPAPTPVQAAPQPAPGRPPAQAAPPSVPAPTPAGPAPTPAATPITNAMDTVDHQRAAAAAGQLNQQHSPAGGKLGKRKKKRRSRGSDKGKFRETLWFKKGELDAQAAAEAASKAQHGEAAPDKADSLPIEDRYEDDGTLTAADRKYSLKTGHTTTMAAIEDKRAAAAATSVSEEDLISEMKSGRGKVIALLLGAVLVAGGVIAFLVMRTGDGDSKKEPKKSLLVTADAGTVAAPVDPKEKTAAQLVADLEKLAAKACACTDAACAKVVEHELKEYAGKLGPAKPAPSGDVPDAAPLVGPVKQADDAVKKAHECITKLTTAKAPVPDEGDSKADKKKEKKKKKKRKKKRRRRR